MSFFLAFVGSTGAAGLLLESVGVYILCHVPVCVLKCFRLMLTSAYLFVYLFLPHQYLCDSSMPRLLSAEAELEICSDKLDLLTTEVTEVPEIILEVHLPPEPLQQNHRTYSRHSSCDSGVYSTEGSGPRQSELGEVETEKFRRKIRVEELDEGVRDVSV